MVEANYSLLINTAEGIIIGRIRYMGMRIRLYVTTPLDISTRLGFRLGPLPGFSFLATVYNNCTWYPKHCQNEEDLEYS